MKASVVLALSLAVFSAQPSFAANAEPTKRPRTGKLAVPPAPKVPTLDPSKAMKKAEPSAAPAAKAAVSAEKRVTIGSGTYVVKDAKKVQYATLFNLDKQYGDSKLIFKVNTAAIKSNYSPHFSWVRIFIGNRLLASEKDFMNKDEISLDLSGTIDPGTNQVVVQGVAAPNTAISWSLTTDVRAKITSIDPTEVALGETLTINGQFFDPKPENNKVSIGGKAAPLFSATDSELKLKVPADCRTGEVDLVLTVNGAKAGSQKITVRGIPEVSGVDWQAIPPGQTLQVFGKNFSKKLGENKVLFDDIEVAPQSGTTEQLTVIVPYVNIVYGAKIMTKLSVKVGKTESKNSLQIKVGPQQFVDPDLGKGNDFPIYGSPF